jgi:hypothetical protein
VALLWTLEQAWRAVDAGTRSRLDGGFTVLSEVTIAEAYGRL